MAYFAIKGAKLKCPMGSEQSEFGKTNVVIKGYPALGTLGGGLQPAGLQPNLQTSERKKDEELFDRLRNLIEWASTRDLQTATLEFVNNVEIEIEGQW